MLQDRKKRKRKKTITGADLVLTWSRVQLLLWILWWMSCRNFPRTHAVLAFVQSAGIEMGVGARCASFYEKGLQRHACGYLQHHHVQQRIVVVIIIVHRQHLALKYMHSMWTRAHPMQLTTVSPDAPCMTACFGKVSTEQMFCNTPITRTPNVSWMSLFTQSANFSGFLQLQTVSTLKLLPAARYTVTRRFATLGKQNGRRDKWRQYQAECFINPSCTIRECVRLCQLLLLY